MPVLRFPEFSGEWEEKKLGDFIQSYIERVSSKTGISVYSSSRNGLKPQREYYDDRELQNDGEYGIVPRGFFTYRHMSDDLTFKFNINTFEDKIAVSKEYPVFKTVGLDSVFLLCKLNHGKDFKSFAIKQKMGGTRTRLYFKNLSNWKASFPSLLEQQKIAEFFGVVDEKIAGLSKKKASLERYKKGVMQKIFSKEICFKDENGKSYPKWDDKRLGEVAVFQKGKNISKEDISENGNLECIRYGEIYTSYKEVINLIKSRTHLKSETLILSESNDVIIPASGETQWDIAIASCVLKDGVALGGDINIIRNKENGVFLAYYLSNAKRKDIARLSQGNSVVHLYSSQLKFLKLLLPSLSEQKKIADFLMTLDEKISALGNELSYAKEFKKGLLQQMFV